MTGGHRLASRTALALVVAGLLAPLLPTTYAQDPEPEPYLERDTAGDASPFGGSSLPFPAGSSVDVREVGLSADDLFGFRVRIKLGDLRGDTGPAWSARSSISFTAQTPGDNYTFELRWPLNYPIDGPAPSGVQPVAATLCLEAVHRFGPCEKQRVRAWVDWGRSEVHAYVTKDALMGRAPLEGQSALRGLPIITKGSALSVLEVETERYLGLNRIGDRWPERFEDVSPPYRFEAESANLNLTVSRPAPRATNGSAAAPERTVAPAVLSVMPGVATAVPLTIENHNRLKRLVQVEASFVEASDRWRAEIVPAVQIPGNDRRVVTLLINASTDVQHLESAVVRVVARSLAREEIGAIELDLLASVPPSPDRRILYLHAAEPANGSNTYCIGCPPAVTTWMNTLREDARAGLDDAGFRVSPRTGAGLEDVRLTARFELDTPLVRDLVLDAGQRIRGQVALDADRAFQGHVTLTLTTGRTLLTKQERDGVTLGSSPITFDLVVPKARSRITPAHGTLTMTLDIVASAQEAATLSATGVRIVPRESRLELPAVTDPEAGLDRTTLANAYLSLTALSDPQEFVNPGRARLLNFTLLNEGHDVADAKLHVDHGSATEGAPTGWSMELLPSAAFRLQGGESVRVGLLVRPPPTAREGDTEWIRVNATGLLDPRLHSQLRFHAITTRSVEFADESDHFRADADDRAKVLGGGPVDTPAPSLLTILLVLAGVMVAWRRPTV